MGYLRKRGEPRPIAVTSQDIAITMWAIGFLFVMIVIVFAPVKMDAGRYFYLFERESFLMLQIVALICFLISTVWLCYGISKYNLNMWLDKLHPDWQGWIRSDKTGQITCQIAKKDSLGYSKGIAFNKKAGVISRKGFKTNLPNGNSVIFVFDPMSHNADILEAVGWKLYKKIHGFIGYNAYVQFKKGKIELIKTDEKVIEDGQKTVA